MVPCKVRWIQQQEIPNAICRLGTYVNKAQQFLGDVNETCVSLTEVITDRVSKLKENLAKTISNKIDSFEI